ncbi:MAG: S26 family signal peptidase [Candidatus Zixiibacteriota bacterium]
MNTAEHVSFSNHIGRIFRLLDPRSSVTITLAESKACAPKRDSANPEQLPGQIMTGRSYAFSFLLHLLLPGAAHVFWREYLFGVFIFLVTVLASVLFIVSILISLPIGAVVVLYTLPLLFYVFTFFDLTRTIKSKRVGAPAAPRKAVLFLLISIAYQVFSPIAPVNFVFRNRPELFIQRGSQLSPLYDKGDVLLANRLAFKLDIIAVRKPILHALPERFDVVRFETESNRRQCAVVIGLPGEHIEVVEGVIVADGRPIIGEPPGGIVLTGDWPLTVTDSYSILVATVNLGRIVRIDQVSFPALIGKVNRLL